VVKEKHTRVSTRPSSGAALDYSSLLESVRTCQLCADDLDHGVRPVLQFNPQARILIAGQAPGSRVHDTGIPFDDPSGKRLRDWMHIDKATFYDAEKIAILPMGFCYPGKGHSGDLPPRSICADTWRTALMTQLPRVKLTLAIGQYAQAWHLANKQPTLTDTVRQWQQYPQNIIPLPHPSPGNNIWLKRNPWFEVDLLPQLRLRVKRALADSDFT